MDMIFSLIKEINHDKMVAFWWWEIDSITKMTGGQ